MKNKRILHILVDDVYVAAAAAYAYAVAPHLAYLSDCKMQSMNKNAFLHELN